MCHFTNCNRRSTRTLPDPETDGTIDVCRRCWLIVRGGKAIVFAIVFWTIAGAMGLTAWMLFNHARDIPMYVPV